MKYFQFIALILAYFLTTNFVHASSNHDHETEKNYMNKQIEDSNSIDDQQSHKKIHDNHSDDKHDHNEEHKHKHK